MAITAQPPVDEKTGKNLSGDSSAEATTGEDVLTTSDNQKIALTDDALRSGRRPIEAGGVALTVLATIAFVFVLQWAHGFFIPLIFGVLVAYTLNPVVNWLERKVPRAVGVGIVMLGLLASTALVAISVNNEVQAIVDELPFATYKLANAIDKSNDGKLGPLERLRSISDALKKAASSATGATADTDGKKDKTASAPPPAKPPTINLNDWLWAGAVGVMAFIGQLAMILFLVFFALLSGDTFKRKLVKLTGPSLTNKKITVHILDDINTSIQRYMFMLLVTNVSLALVTWVTLHWIGLNNPGAWAVSAGLLHVIPYFGPLVAAVAMGFAALFQFESFSMMFLVFGAFLTISTIVGMLVTTWMTGRIAKMNATAVFIALLFGQWLWGVWGMLLCVPLIVVIKVISERVEGMQPIAELLGE
jgi:predicted PurR-regulated permease PerM